MEEAIKQFLREQAERDIEQIRIAKEHLDRAQDIKNAYRSGNYQTLLDDKNFNASNLVHDANKMRAIQFGEALKDSGIFDGTDLMAMIMKDIPHNMRSYINLRTNFAHYSDSGFVQDIYDYFLGKDLAGNKIIDTLKDNIANVLETKRDLTSIQRLQLGRSLEALKNINDPTLVRRTDIGPAILKDAYGYKIVEASKVYDETSQVLKDVVNGPFSRIKQQANSFNHKYSTAFIDDKINNDLITQNLIDLKRVIPKVSALEYIEKLDFAKNIHGDLKLLLESIVYKDIDPTLKSDLLFYFKEISKSYNSGYYSFEQIKEFVTILPDITRGLDEVSIWSIVKYKRINEDTNAISNIIRDFQEHTSKKTFSRAIVDPFSPRVRVEGELQRSELFILESLKSLESEKLKRAVEGFLTDSRIQSGEPGVFNLLDKSLCKSLVQTIIAMESQPSLDSLQIKPQHQLDITIAMNRIVMELFRISNGNEPDQFRDSYERLKNHFSLESETYSSRGLKNLEQEIERITENFFSDKFEIKYKELYNNLTNDNLDEIKIYAEYILSGDENIRSVFPDPNTQNLDVIRGVRAVLKYAKDKLNKNEFPDRFQFIKEQYDEASEVIKKVTSKTTGEAQNKQQSKPDVVDDDLNERPIQQGEQGDDGKVVQTQIKDNQKPAPKAPEEVVDTKPNDKNINIQQEAEVIFEKIKNVSEGNEATTYSTKIDESSKSIEVSFYDSNNSRISLHKLPYAEDIYLDEWKNRIQATLDRTSLKTDSPLVKGHVNYFGKGVAKDPIVEVNNFVASEDLGKTLSEKRYNAFTVSQIDGPNNSLYLGVRFFEIDPNTNKKVSDLISIKIRVTPRRAEEINDYIKTQLSNNTSLEYVESKRGQRYFQLSDKAQPTNTVSTEAQEINLSQKQKDEADDFVNKTKNHDKHYIAFDEKNMQVRLRGYSSTGLEEITQVIKLDNQAQIQAIKSYIEKELFIEILNQTTKHKNDQNLDSKKVESPDKETVSDLPQEINLSQKQIKKIDNLIRDTKFHDRYTIDYKPEKGHVNVLVYPSRDNPYTLQGKELKFINRNISINKQEGSPAAKEQFEAIKQYIEQQIHETGSKIYLIPGRKRKKPAEVPTPENKTLEFRDDSFKPITVEFNLDENHNPIPETVIGDDAGTIRSFNNTEIQDNTPHQKKSDNESLRYGNDFDSKHGRALGKNALRVQLLDIYNNIRKADIYRESGREDLALEYEKKAKSGAIMLSGIMALSSAATKYGLDKKVSDFILDNAKIIAEGDSEIAHLAGKVSKSKIIANLPVFDMTLTPITYGFMAYNATDQDQANIIASQGLLETSTLIATARFAGANNPVSLAATELVNYVYYLKYKNDGANPSIINSLSLISGDIASDKLSDLTEIRERMKFSSTYEEMENKPFGLYFYQFDNDNKENEQFIVPILRMNDKYFGELPEISDLSNSTQEYVKDFSTNLAQEIGVPEEDLYDYVSKSSIVEMAYMKTLTESDLFDSNNRQEFVKAELRKYIDRHNELRIFAEQLSEFSKYSNDNQNSDVFESRGVHNYDIPYFYPPIDNEYIVTPEIPEELHNYGQTKYNADNPQQKRDFNNLTYTQKMAFISSSLSQDMFDYNSYNAPEKNKTDKEKTQELYEQYLSFHLGIESLNEGYLPTHRKGSHANYNYQLENFYAAGGPSYLANSVQDYESQIIALQIESIFEDYQTQVLDEIKDIEENVNPMLKKSQLSQIEMDSIRAEFERISDRFEEYKDYMRSKDDVFSLSGDQFAQEWISGLQTDLANLKAEITKSIGQKLKQFKYEESQQRSEEAKQEFGENPDTPLELDYIPEEIRIFQNAIDRKIPVPEQYLDFNEVLKDFIGTDEQKENLEELMRQYLKIWQSPATGYNQEGVPDEIYRESVLQPMEQIATIDPTIITNSDIDLSTLMQISYLPESSKEDNNASVANLAKNMLMDINPMKIPDEYSHINPENYKEQISSQHLLQNINLLVELISQTDLSKEQIDSLKYICEEAIEHYNPTSGGAEIYQSIIPNLQRSRAQLVNSLQGEFSDQETQLIDDIIVQVGAKIETSHREYNKINGGLFDLPGSQNRAENKAKYQQTYIGKDNIASLINDIRSTLASLENYEESNDRKIFQRG